MGTPPVMLTVSRVYDLWSTINSRSREPVLVGWRLCANDAGFDAVAKTSECFCPLPLCCLCARGARDVLSCCGVGVQSANTSTPPAHILEQFSQQLDLTGIRGQVLDYTGKRGPSKFQQRRLQIERNIKLATEKDDAAKLSKWSAERAAFQSRQFPFNFQQVHAAWFEPSRAAVASFTASFRFIVAASGDAAAAAANHFDGIAYAAYLFISAAAAADYTRADAGSGDTTHHNSMVTAAIVAASGVTASVAAASAVAASTVAASAVAASTVAASTVAASATATSAIVASAIATSTVAAPAITASTIAASVVAASPVAVSAVAASAVAGSRI
jgi:hypothetical protein